MPAAIVTATKAAITIACGAAGFAVSQACAPGSNGTGGFTLGVAAGNVLQGVVSNYGKDVGDWLSGKAGILFAHSAGPATNHDLDDLAAQAIFNCIAIAKNNSAGLGDIGAFAAAMSKANTAHIRDLLRCDAFAEVDDAAMLMLIGQSDGGMHTTAQTSAYWQSFVRALATKLDVPIPSDDALTFLGGWIHRELAAQANDILRNTFGPQGRPYVAVQMLFAQQTLTAVVGGNATTHELLREVLSRLESFAPGTLMLVDQRIAEHARIAAEESTAGHRESTRGANAATEARDILKGLISASHTLPANNFASALHVPKVSGFRGRTQELGDITRLLDAAGTGEAIVITAAPGVGKSALAVTYGGTRCAAFDHVWYLLASEVMEEESLAALLCLCGVNADAVQGDHRVSRLDRLATRLLQLLDRTKADGSPRRHLLILDNVEDDATRRRYGLNAHCRVLITAREARLAINKRLHLKLGPLDPASGRDVLTAKVPEWNTPEHEGALNSIGEHVAWNAAALGYLAAALYRRSTKSPEMLLKLLKASELGHANHPTHAMHDHERPEGWTQGLADAFAVFIEPFKDGPTLLVLEVAALCQPEGIPLWWLRASAELDEPQFDDALQQLIDAGVLTADGDLRKPAEQTATIHSLTQSLVRGRWVGDNQARKADSLARMARVAEHFYRTPQVDDDNRVYDAEAEQRLQAAPHVEAFVELLEDHALAARLLTSAADALRTAGKYDAALRMLDTAEQWYNAPDHDLSIDTCAFYSSLLIAAREAGRYDRAWQAYERLKDNASSLYGSDSGGYAVFLGNTAVFLEEVGALEEAEAVISESIDALEQSFTAPPGMSDAFVEAVAQSHLTRSSIRVIRGNFVGAADDIQNAQRAFAGLGVVSDWRQCELLQKSGNFAKATGDLAAAEKHYQQVRQRYLSAKPKNETSVHFVARRLAVAQCDLGKCEEALATVQTAIDFFARQTPQDNYTQTLLRSVRGLIFGRTSRLDEAKSEVDESIRWFKDNVPKAAHLLLELLRFSAEIHARRGEWNIASANITEAVDLHAQVYGENHPWTKRARIWQAKIAKQEIPPLWHQAPG